jgi:hypothetical protein
LNSYENCGAGCELHLISWTSSYPISMFVLSESDADSFKTITKLYKELGVHIK